MPKKSSPKKVDAGKFIVMDGDIIIAAKNRDDTSITFFPTLTRASNAAILEVEEMVEDDNTSLDVAVYKLIKVGIVGLQATFHEVIEEVDR